VDTRTIPKDKRIRKARTLALREAVERFNHEDMGTEERLLLVERIKRLRKQVETESGVAL
jgi:hypothetical protein